jgi:hypothetical protein
MTDLTQLKQARLYCEELGIDLPVPDDEQYFRWFLASLLFSGQISETIARHTYQPASVLTEIKNHHGEPFRDPTVVFY